ncbi:MAG: hypothetical protein M3273_08795 [Actinomycetota bacterium]|nr:hypothetical protein [Actinomycetota bacterium]
MGRNFLQVLEVAALVAIAVPTHVCMARIRRPYLAHLEEVAGKVVRPFAEISDVIAALLYVGFAAATVPVSGGAVVPSHTVESVFDSVALFAVFVATVQLVSLVTLRRVADHHDPWLHAPPEPAAAA